MQKVLKVKGMQCVSCEELICNSLNELKSVTSSANFNKSEVEITYDEKIINIRDLVRVIENEGFKVDIEIKDSGKGKSKNETKNAQEVNLNSIIETIVIILGVNYIISHLFGINIIRSVLNILSDLISNVPVIDENTSFVFLFVIGLLTSFHCVAMCGGINVTQCLAFKGDNKNSPNIMYNLGRVTSYTILGGIVGAIGSVFSISTDAQSVLYIIVGSFMVLMGLNLFGVNIGRRFFPHMPKKFRNINKNGNGPYIIGLLNGFMPCGPLQSMQLYALSTGSFVQGALSMFLFSAGTVPLMFVFGKIGDFKNPKIAKQFMKVSALLVLILGIAMASRGLSLLGINTGSVSSVNQVIAQDNGDEQVIYTDLESRRYPDIVVEKGKKVKWVINASRENLNGCNNEIIIKEYGIRQQLGIGENVIEFTPTESGVFGYSCWMGMIRASITVID